MEPATGRQFRNTWPVARHAGPLDAPGNMCKSGAGPCGKNIVVNEDGSVTISRKAYADDVVAFALGCIQSNPTISLDTKLHLARFVDDMDARAVARHGYSYSEPDRALEWKSVVDGTTKFADEVLKQ